MADKYSVELCKRLARRFEQYRLHRPYHVRRYDAGDELEYDVEPADSVGEPCRVRIVVERFVGGGFAGQVYKVRVVESNGALKDTLVVGEAFALKVLIPPSTFSRLFRNLLYFIGFQGAFQPQINPAAARAGALWQKFIRRGARIRFGDESCVNDVHGTLVDHTLGSCGEISDWIDGRLWQLEVDDRVDLLRRWRRGQRIDESKLGSPEFRAKRKFMAYFVTLLNDMGAHEFARQYEWSTWKSQPNCLKRMSTDDDPKAGLTAVDFRAGLTLLPFLPMSPGDIMLILKGLGRGSLVQFDRGDLKTLEAFIQANSEEFADMEPLLDELVRVERIYRDSLIDITHNHYRLLFSASLWKQIFESIVTGWRVRSLVDGAHASSLRGRSIRIALLQFLGALPILGPIFLKAWGREDYRRHYGSLLRSLDYIKRAVAGKMAEQVVVWHRDGRIVERKAERIASSFVPFVVHAAVSFLPQGAHRFLTDAAYMKERLHYMLVRPVRLYFDAGLREEWLRDMVTEGRRKRIISRDDGETILSRIKEPFIQKYLKSLAVHVCTLPVTQVVSVIIGIGYVLMHPELPRAQAWAIGVGIIALFQVVPVSPGSLVRGLYVVYLVVRERNFRDYNIAVFLGFFKYVGYLAFPIQMAYRYPTLARFMAAHWATEGVHIVPVFGERGALLEHKVFTLFYNVPLTVRGRVRRRAEMRATKRARRWHLLPLAGGGALLLVAAEFLYERAAGLEATFGDIWWALLAAPLLCGSLATLGAGGTSLGKRIMSAALSGVVMGVLYSGLSFALAGRQAVLTEVATTTAWLVFILTVLTPVGAIITEVTLPEP